MRLGRIALMVLAFLGIASCAPQDDMESLRTSCETAAETLKASLNNTMQMNTSDIVQKVVWEVGASKANLGVSIASTAAINVTATYDSAYFDYIDAVRTLSEAVSRRGRLFHQEMNFPVYSALRGLETVIHAYGLQLCNFGLISQRATIRTFTAGSSIVDAESVWANNVNYPGSKKGWLDSCVFEDWRLDL